VLTLYDYLPSQNGWKVRVLMGLLALPYRSRPVAIFGGETQSEEILARNPVGAIPILELSDGRSIAESNAILCYLAAGTRFLPAEPFLHAKVMQWLFFEQYYVEPTIGSLRFWTLTGRLAKNAGAMVESRRQSAARALGALERLLIGQQFLVGDELTIADLAVYAYTHLAADAGFDLTQYPAVAQWLQRVATAIGPCFPVHRYGPEAQV
jgi:glutathione S-transferase